MNIKDVMTQYEVAITDGMARSLWVMAFAEWAERLKEDGDENAPDPGPGGDWEDEAGDTPDAAYHAANGLIELFAADEGMDLTQNPMATLFGIAMEAEYGEPYEYLADPEFKNTLEVDTANDFGGAMAMEALGTGVAWSDDHNTKSGSAVFDPSVPRFECHYEDGVLSWNGRPRSKNAPIDGVSGSAEAIGPRVPGLVYVNPNDLSMTQGAFRRWRTFLMRFGGFTEATAAYLVIYADGIDSAIGEMIDWVRDNRPDSLANDARTEAFEEAMRERGLDPEGEIDWNDPDVNAAQEEAEADLTSGGNYGDYINSEDWSIVGEDLSRQDLINFARDQGFLPKRAAQQNPSRKKRRARGGR